MNTAEKLQEILKFEFIFHDEDSNWFMSWDIARFADVIAYDEKYGTYYVYSVEANNTKLRFEKRTSAHARQDCSFEEIFEALPRETREKIIFHFDLFRE